MTGYPFRVPKASLKLLWLILPLAVAFLIVVNHSRAQGMLADTDTKVLLAAIRQQNDPLHWFTADWPLRNHFYRPISTLFFELDNALYGDQAWGYGLTNALLAAASIMLVFWLVREAFEDWALAGLSSFVFGLWHGVTYWDARLVNWVLLALAALAVLGIFRGGRHRVLPSLLAAFACLFAAAEYQPTYVLSFRMIEWLPGRTASVMTVFCLAAMAAYARWERLGSGRAPKEAEATERPWRAVDPPPTDRQKQWAWVWLVLAFVSLALALGSYEQAIMLPGCLFGLAVLFAVKGWRPRWAVHAGFWVLLGGYLWLRSVLVPGEVSGYQAQQFRDGPGVFMDVMNYLAPAWNYAATAASTWIPDPIYLLTGAFWTPIIAVLSFLGMVVVAAKDEQKWPILCFWLLALVAFLPMAWFKVFEHYHYWPNALRAVAMVMLIGAAGRAATASLSLPMRQAPPRSGPAPGSLPRP